MPLAEFELSVLLAVVHCADGAYAVSVHDELVRRRGRPVATGAVYVTLDRLERKGLLRSRLGEPTAERGGRAKRFYALTRAGTSAVKAERRALQRLWEGIDPLGEES